MVKKTCKIILAIISEHLGPTQFLKNFSVEKKFFLKECSS